MRGAFLSQYEIGGVPGSKAPSSVTVRRGGWLLAPWARGRRRGVGGAGGRWAIGDLGPDVAGVLWGVCGLSLSPWPRRGPAIGHGMQRGPATW